MKKISVETYVSLLVVILGAVFLRLIPHAPNVAPIAALALFSGAKIPGWKGVIIPLLAMIGSDLLLGFHSTIPYVYGSFVLISSIGSLLRKNESPVTIPIASLSGSVLFFIITNFGSWVTTTLYEKSITGLMKCYEMGFPFLRNTIVGDLLYTTVFFVGFAVLQLLIVLMLPSAHKAERHVGNTV